MGLMMIDEEFDIDEQSDYVTVWGKGTLNELQKIIDRYRKLGFNTVWHGHENSTLCLGKIKEV